MLNEVYFNLSYISDIDNKVWLHYYDPKKQMVLHDYTIRINYDMSLNL